MLEVNIPYKYAFLLSNGLNSYAALRCLKTSRSAGAKESMIIASITREKLSRIKGI